MVEQRAELSTLELLARGQHGARDVGEDRDGAHSITTSQWSASASSGTTGTSMPWAASHVRAPSALRVETAASVVWARPRCSALATALPMVPRPAMPILRCGEFVMGPFCE